MNSKEGMKKTLVSVHGYAGDVHQIREHVNLYTHHSCPVVILSPGDSKISVVGPHICRFGGKRAYIGPLSLERQRKHLEILLEYPFDFFLANDSDSFCVECALPDYIYERDVLWSNEVSDKMHKRAPGYPWPQLAFQPPYFMSRRIIKKLIEASYKVPCDPLTPFIDWCMMSWAVAGDIPHANYANGMSCPTSDSHSFSVMRDHVRNQGKIFVHSIKTLHVANQLILDRQYYRRTH